MSEGNDNRVERLPRMFNLAGWIIGLVAFVVYCATLSKGAYPGHSAEFIVRNTGLLPRMNASMPLWHWLVQAIAALPGDDLAFRINLFSALCGAGAVILLQRIVAAFIFDSISEFQASRRKRLLAARLAGVGSCLYLAFSIPFWLVSNRAHPGSFHVLLFLLVIELFCLYLRTSSIKNACLFAFVYSVGCVEFATLIVFAPLFGCFLLFALWKRKQLAVRSVIGIVGCAVLGLLAYLVAAWELYGCEGYVLSKYSGLWDVMLTSWQQQYRLIMRSMTKTGWLLVLVVSALPWFVGLGIKHRALNGEKDWTFYILHFCLTLLGCGIIMNFVFSPWRLFGPGKMLLVTPYVLSASVFGYLLAYWFLLPAIWWEESETTWKIMVRERLGLVIALALLCFAVVAPFKNISITDARSSAVMDQYADAVIDALDGRSWLLTGGDVDSHVMIAARDRGVDLTIVNLRSGNQRYRDYVASKFDDLRLRTLARVGMRPLVREWFRIDSDIEQSVAVLNRPDLFLGAGMDYIPNKVLYLGTRRRESLDGAEMFRTHVQFWDSFLPVVANARQSRTGMGAFADNLMLQFGKLANNLGFLLEDLGKDALAYRSYMSVREIDPQNISAVMNLAGMIRRGYEGGDAEEIEAQIKNFALDRTKYRIDTISARYGYVRVPSAFADMAWLWLQSGQHDIAQELLKRGLALGGEKSRLMWIALARIYATGDDYAQSMEIYKKMIEQNPESPMALLGMARIMMESREYAAAEEYINAAEMMGGRKTFVDLERAMLMLAKGDLAAARKKLEELIELKPKWAVAWALLANVISQQGDHEALELCVRSIDAQQVKGFAISLTLGRIEEEQNELGNARAHYSKALRIQPGSLLLLQLLLGLDVRQGRSDLGLGHARQLLALDSENAAAHLVLASLYMKNDDYELAEHSLRTCLKSGRSASLLNELAWVVAKQGRYKEARTYALEALGVDQESSSAWDTLGVIKMRMGELDEADDAFKKSVALNDEDLRVMLHIAELEKLKGNSARAKELVKMLQERKDELPAGHVADLELLEKSL